MANLRVTGSHLIVENSATSTSINFIYSRFVGGTTWFQTLTKVGDGIVDTLHLGYGNFELQLDGSEVVFQNVKGLADGTGDKWGGWIYASFVNHFTHNRPENSQIFLDGERFHNAPPEIRVFCLKVDGPFYYKIGRGTYRAKVRVGVDSRSNKSDVDAQYQFRFFLDKLAALFTSIPIYRYGEDEPGTMFDCAALDSSYPLQVMYYGEQKAGGFFGRGISQQMYHMAGIEMFYNLILRR